ADDARVAEVLARATRYQEAGADGLFVPKVVDPADIRAIASGTTLPLNVLAWPGLAAAAELAVLGVRRLSSGSAISQGALERAAAVAGAFLRDGRSASLFEAVMPYPDVNALFRR